MPSEQQSGLEPRHHRANYALPLLIASLAYLYLLLFIPPATPLLVGTDGPTLLYDAKRMLDGQIMYRDFFQIVPPGTQLVFYALFELFGARLWIPGAVLLVLGLGFVWLSLIISRQVMSPRAAILPAALFLVLPFGRFLDPTHHWFSALAVLGAIAVLLEKRTASRVVVAGALCGLAACFTVNRGVVGLVGLGVFLLWENRRNSLGRRALVKMGAFLLAGFLVTAAAVNAYFIWKAGLGRLLYCTVVFGAKYYPADINANTWKVLFSELQPIPPWWNLTLLVNWIFLHALVPLSFLLFFLRYRRQRRNNSQAPWPKLMLVAIVGAALFLGTAPAPAMNRVAADSLPALILLAWLLDSPAKTQRMLRRLLWTGLVLLVLVGVPVRQFRWRGILNAPGGRLAILEPVTYEEFAWLSRHTRPHDDVFVVFYAEPYFYLDLRNPTRVPFLSASDYTRPAQVAEVVQDLEKHQVRYVLWIGEEKGLQVGQENPGDHLDPLRTYLHEHYRISTILNGDLRIWERNPAGATGNTD